MLMDDHQYVLNLANCLPRSTANGPGTRMVLWVQGCPFRCEGCQNPDYLAFRLNQVVTIDQIWEKFCGIPDLAGISFSGGEPFSQAVALANLAHRVQNIGKTVVCWSGYKLADLKRLGIPGSQELLSSIDLLIDGFYLASQQGNYPLRGSSNQDLHYLSGRIQPEDLDKIPRQEWILQSDSMTYTGFPL